MPLHLPSRDRRLGRATGGLVALLAVATLAGCAPAAQGAGQVGTSAAASATGSASGVVPEDAPTSIATATPEPAGAAVADPAAAPESALATALLLEVKGRAPKTGYAREQFGASWKDTDQNGCDQRNDVLARDLTNVVHKAGTRDCVVLTGDLADPYSGRWIAFQRGESTSTLVQIDHVVALSDAWQKGAQQWAVATREKFANDWVNLLAVDGPLNGQKSDGDAATWLPPNKAFRCEYVARQVGVKHTYGLWATQAERDAIVGVLSSCPDQPLPAGVVPPTVAPTPVAEPTPVPEPAAVAPAPAAVAEPADVYYKNCSAARAAGAAPVRSGQPGYASHLDGDGDGVGCE